MRRSAAIGLALLSAALFGASTPAAKWLLGAMSPWLLAGLLYLGSGLGLGAVLLGRRVLRLAAEEAPIRAGDLPWLAGAVLFGGAVGPVLLMLGLARTPASSAALLLNLEGLATMAIAWVVFRENVDRRLLLGAFAILAGAMLLAWNGTALGSLPLGALLVAGACVAWGIDNNLTRKISDADRCDQGSGGRQRQRRNRPGPRRRLAGVGTPRRGRRGRPARLRRQPDVLHPGAAAPGDRANRGLFL